LMGARPMARVIQEHIKKPLADEVLFGRLKAGGHVRVILVKEEDGKEKLGFEYLEGPVTPKPEKIPVKRPKAKRAGPRKPKPQGPKGGGSGPSGPGRGSVPKVPLVKA
jgi:ATP-dependent Clp protease ATP-binding subunit ClpA